MNAPNYESVSGPRFGSPRYMTTKAGFDVELGFGVVT